MGRKKMASGFRPHPTYEGPVKACVFDWAGTVVDAGVFAPVLTFQKLFEDEGVPISSEEVRAPMGVHKRIHIQKIIETPAVAARWLQKKGKKPTDDDAERIYSKSLTATLDVLPNNSHLIRGAAATIDLLRSKYGIKFPQLVTPLKLWQNLNPKLLKRVMHRIVMSHQI